MKNGVKTVIFIIISLVFLAMFGSALRSALIFFMVIWFILPIVGFVAKNSVFLSFFTRKGIVCFRGFLLAISILISFGLFSNYDNIRDQLGARYLKNYKVEYHSDSDIYGRPISESYVYSKGLSAKFILWASQYILIIFCIGMPVLTWKSTSHLIKDWDNQKLKD